MPNNKEKAAFSSLLPILAFIKPYKWVVFAALGALLLTAGVNLSLGQGVKFVIDHGFIAGSQAQLQQAVMVLIGLISLLAVGTFCRFYLMSWIGERVSNDIRKAVFDRIVTLHPSYFEENRSGELMSRLTTDTTLLQSIIGSSFSMALRSSLMLIGGFGYATYNQPKANPCGCCLRASGITADDDFWPKSKKTGKLKQDAIADISTYAGEIIQNIKVVQSYSHEEREKAAFSEETNKAFQVAKSRIKQRSFLIAAVIFLTFSAISVMLWVGGSDVLAGTMTGGELGAFVFYAIMVAMSVATVAEVYGELQRAAGAAARLLELLAVESMIKSPDTNHDAQLEENKLNHPAIQFNDVSFHYPSRPDKAALNALNLQVKQGQTVAIVGPSGAGKTTLFELLQRFYDPSSGSISLAGIDIKALSLDCLRQQMGMVAQNPILFSSDVMHNIRYGNPSASDEQVYAAAKYAHADEFIKQLPDGYHSFLGEQGVRLSGGQKQRIVLARAILKDPAILLLDEATSALDAQSEFHVQAALEHLMKDRTTLIIAHRLATVKHADVIVVMDKGEIIATGTHQQLFETNPLYKQLCELQFNRD